MNEDTLPFWSFWAESHQSKPKSCSCKPPRSWSVSPQSCSCPTLTRGNKCRCPGMWVHSPARWSSPSSASWTSCCAHTRGDPNKNKKTKNKKKSNKLSLWAKPADGKDADRAASFNVEPNTMSLQSVSSEQAEEEEEAEEEEGRRAFIVKDTNECQ